MTAIRLAICALLVLIPVASHAQAPPPQKPPIVACDGRRAGDTCAWQDAQGVHTGVCRERWLGPGPHRSAHRPVCIEER